VPAPELEALVVDAVRRHSQANSTAPNPILETDRERSPAEARSTAAVST
jgi:hypothetical protein